MSVHVYIYKISVHNRYGGSSKFGTKNEEHTKAVGTAMWHFFNWLQNLAITGWKTVNFIKASQAAFAGCYSL